LKQRKSPLFFPLCFSRKRPIGNSGTFFGDTPL
jgi:hypothetical protein